MKRNRPDPAALERARQSAREARVKAGLAPDAPEDAEYERLRAEARERKRERECLFDAADLRVPCPACAARAGEHCVALPRARVHQRRRKQRLEK